jgi:hypothetical protein
MEDAALIVLGILPPKARAKLARLQGQRDDCRALLATLSERRRAIDNQLAIAVQNLSAGPPSGDPRDAATRARLEAEVRAIQDQVNEIERTQRARQNALYAAEHVLPAIEEWLRINSFGPVDLSGGSAFADVVIDPGSLRDDGETAETAVRRIRNEIYRLGAEMRTIHDAPRPASEVKAALIATIDGLAAQGRPSLDLAAGQVKVTWPDGYAMGSGVQPLAATKLVAWLFNSELKAAMIAGIHDLPGGIPMAGRAEREAEIAKRIRRLEFEEETLIEAAASDGITIARRDRMAVEALLLIVPKFEVEAEVAAIAAE